MQGFSSDFHVCVLRTEALFPSQVRLEPPVSPPHLVAIVADALALLPPEVFQLLVCTPQVLLESIIGVAQALVPLHLLLVLVPEPLNLLVLLLHLLFMLLQQYFELFLQVLHFVGLVRALLCSGSGLSHSSCIVCLGLCALLGVLR